MAIKASVGFKKSTAKDVLARANAVYEGVFTAKDDYPNPPVDQATLKSQIDGLSGGITAALDGGKRAIAARDYLKEVVIKSLRQLGHYAEENCKDEMQTFLKSGFQPAFTIRTFDAGSVGRDPQDHFRHEHRPDESVAHGPGRRAQLSIAAGAGRAGRNAR
jgi:hypothetical protein